jgi:MFS family permease
VQIWHVFAYVTVSGIAQAILQPVRSALVANTVPREDLGNAYALHAMGITSSRFVLPAVGGLLIGAFGFTVNFFVESALYVALALLVIPMRTPYREQSSRGHHSSTFADLKEGVKYVWTDKPIKQLLVMSFVPNFFVQPCLYLLPVLRVHPQ